MSPATLCRKTHLILIVYQMGRLCGGAHEISSIKAPLFLHGWVGVVGWSGGGDGVGGGGGVDGFMVGWMVYWWGMLWVVEGG